MWVFIQKNRRKVDVRGVVVFSRQLYNLIRYKITLAMFPQVNTFFFLPNYCLRFCRAVLENKQHIIIKQNKKLMKYNIKNESIEKTTLKSNL